MFSEKEKPVANRRVVFREEFDDWAVLFDPESDLAFGVNPVGALIWKSLDGSRSLGDIVEAVKLNCRNVPPDVETHVRQFIQELLDRGFAGTEVKGD